MDGIEGTNAKDDTRELLQKDSLPSAPKPESEPALDVAIPIQQGEVIEVANPPSPDAMSEMTEYTHLVSKAEVIGDAMTVTTAASTATAGTGPPRGSDETASRNRIEWARQKLAAQKAAGSGNANASRGNSRVCLADVHTSEAHYRHKVDKLKLRALLSCKAPEDDVLEHVDSMLLNNKKDKPDDLAIIEEVDEMEEQLYDIIHQRDGDEGVQLAREKEATILSVMAASSALLQKNTNRGFDMLENNLIESTNAGFEKTRKGLKDVQNEVELSRVRLEYRSDKQSATLGDMTNMQDFKFRKQHGPDALAFVKGLRASGRELDEEAFSRIEELSSIYNASKGSTKTASSQKHYSKSRNPRTSRGELLNNWHGGPRGAPDARTTRHHRCTTKRSGPPPNPCGLESGTTELPGTAPHVEEEVEGPAAVVGGGAPSVAAPPSPSGGTSEENVTVQESKYDIPVQHCLSISTSAKSTATRAMDSNSPTEKTPNNISSLSLADASEAAGIENAGIDLAAPRTGRPLENAFSPKQTNLSQVFSDQKKQNVVLNQMLSSELRVIKRAFRISVDGMKSADWRKNKASMETQSDLCRTATALASRLLTKFYCQDHCEALYLLSGCLLKDQSQVITAASQAVRSWAEMAARNPRPSEKEGLKNTSTVLVELLQSSSKLSGSCASESIAKLGHDCLKALATATGRHTYLHGIEKILLDCTDKTALKNESRIGALSASLVIVVEECAAAPALLDMKRKGSLLVKAVKECIEHKNQEVRSNGMIAYAKLSERNEFSHLADAVILSVGHKYRERLGR